jgi:hypothetical protein
LGDGGISARVRLRVRWLGLGVRLGVEVGVGSCGGGLSGDGSILEKGVRRSKMEESWFLMALKTKDYGDLVRTGKKKT